MSSTSGIVEKNNDEKGLSHEKKGAQKRNNSRKQNYNQAENVQVQQVYNLQLNQHNNQNNDSNFQYQ